MTAAPSGTAAAQTTGACQSQQNQVNELKAQNIAFAKYMLEEAQADLRDCRQRAAETEHESLRRERSQAGNAYADAAPFSQERRDAAIAWKEANEAVKTHETTNNGNNGNPSVPTQQPYNDGLSDFERHYCIEQRDFGTTESPQNPGNHVGTVTTHGPTTYTYTSNMATATCWD